MPYGTVRRLLTAEHELMRARTFSRRFKPRLEVSVPLLRASLPDEHLIKS
ncbi:hypothetical protein C725_2369 [Pacificimonas flava]|uniref:Uncharacterized protein n=1 Tax=Pacificimonas flava TaxID=1234595 RepID=M2TL09_9SPHN|nr:hypothetical protein C725_2369 [Pacificimonas flava]